LASSPADIPARGWKDVVRRTLRQISEDRVLANAAAVTYFVLLALFPALAALVSVYGLFADPASMERHLDAMAGLLPGGALDIIREQLHTLAAQGGQTLGFTFVSGLMVSLWSANSGIKALFDALNVVYDEEEKRGFFRLNMLSLTFTISTLVFLLIAMAALVVLPNILHELGLKDTTHQLLDILRWPLLLLLAGLALACVYRFGPSRRKPRWRWVTWGSAFAAVAWLVVSLLFSWYASNFGNYNKTYGSLGAVIGFMTWLWISSVVILIGAEINAETEHQTAQDSTEGPPKPLGARGAAMADTVGGQR
jgi:membrane protein